MLPHYLKRRQKFVTAGRFNDPDMRDKAFMCYSANDSCLPIEVPSLKSDHEETDSRAWLHALDGSLINILIFSPDTDQFRQKGYCTAFKQTLLTRKSIFI